MVPRLVDWKKLEGGAIDSFCTALSASSYLFSYYYRTLAIEFSAFITEDWPSLYDWNKTEENVLMVLQSII